MLVVSQTDVPRKAQLSASSAGVLSILRFTGVAKSACVGQTGMWASPGAPAAGEMKGTAS